MAKSFHDIPKVGNAELDELIEKLMKPWDSGPSGGDAMVVDADVAYQAALKIVHLCKELKDMEYLYDAVAGHI